MIIQLDLENIGQRIGKESLKFKSGVVTLIKGRGASGKSRIVKSCALALSYPIKSDDLLKEAIKFGIIKDKNAEYSPLVNSNKEKAKISIKSEGISKTLELKRDGTIKTDNPGEEKFLYSSVLVRNSKIQEYIVQGNSDFSWIVNEMSLAKDYETIREIINSYLELLELTTKEIQDNIKEKTTSLEKLKKLSSDKKSLNVDIKKLEAKIDSIQIKAEITEKRKELLDKKKILNNAIESYKTNLSKLEKENNEINNTINKNQERSEKNRLKILELTKEQKRLEKIDIKKIQKEIIEIQKSETPFVEALGALKDAKKLWNELNIDKESTCPLCDVGTITPHTVKNKRKEIANEIKKIKMKIKEYDNEINEKIKEIKDKNKLSTIKNQIKELDDESFSLLQSANNFKEKLKTNYDRIKSHKDRLNVDQRELEDLNNELKPIEEEMKKNEEVQKILKEKSQLDKKLGGIEKEITDLKNKSEKSDYIKFYNQELNIQIAENIISELEEILIKVRNHLNLQIEEQQEGAAKKFNENMNKLIKELNFSEFKDISLDLEDYNLNVIRTDNTVQSINSLSGSERGIIAAILQICTKETYLPEIPFIVGDDIIMDMDPSRSKIFLNYLKSLAKKNDWIILFTEVTEEDLTIIEI